MGSKLSHPHSNVRGATDPAQPSAACFLLVSHLEEDHCQLHNIFAHSKWNLYHARDIPEATRSMHAVSVIICARDLPPKGWGALFEQTAKVPLAPKFIVASRTGDVEAWRDALDNGAYDVLVTPFAERDVFWIGAQAHLSWLDALTKSHGTARGEELAHPPRTARIRTEHLGSVR